MSAKPLDVEFDISVSGRSDGTLEALYIRIKDAKVARTVEVKPDLLMCDLDEFGEVVGIEVLAPVSLSDLTKLVEQPIRRPFRRFVQQTAPRGMVSLS